jgi:hypothetical protein
MAGGFDDLWFNQEAHGPLQEVRHSLMLLMASMEEWPKLRRPGTSWANEIPRLVSNLVTEKHC